MSALVIRRVTDLHTSAYDRLCYDTSRGDVHSSTAGERCISIWSYLVNGRRSPLSDLLPGSAADTCPHAPLPLKVVMMFIFQRRRCCRVSLISVQHDHGRPRDHTQLQCVNKHQPRSPFLTPPNLNGVPAVVCLTDDPSITSCERHH